VKTKLVRIFAVIAVLVVASMSVAGDVLRVLNTSAAAIPALAFQSLALLGFALVGLMIAVRRPENAIGPLFGASALTWALSSFTLQYATYGLITRPGTLPAANLLGVIGTAAQSVGFLLIFTYLLLLFPTGHLPSPRWRPLFVITTVLLVGLTVDTLLGHIANETQLSPVLRNPMQLIDSTVSDNISTLMTVLLFVASIFCGASLIARARRASGIERQQIKWLGYAAVLCIAFIVFLVVAVFALNGNVSDYIFYIPPVAISGATGISILRYRLFDIDVIINRTLVYGSLTAILVGVYFIGVVGAQALINLLTGQQEQQSPVLIVVTTLLVAALFQPLRRRFQQFIDHRFYRSRYDARKMLDKFGASLRSEVELAHLTSSLLETVENTMHPAHVSLWLRSQDSHTPGRMS
jgi:hypothetical protein